MRRILGTSAVAVALAAVLVLAGGAGPVSACSFAGRELSAPAEVDAGQALEVSGIRFFTIEGSVDADCSGDYELVAVQGVTITAVFQTDSGERTMTMDAPPATDGDPDDFAVGPVEFAVPVDARSVEVTSAPASQTLTIAVIGAPTPTVPPTVSPIDPPPADAVPADPRFTG